MTFMKALGQVSDSCSPPGYYGNRIYEYTLIIKGDSCFINEN